MVNERHLRRIFTDYLHHSNVARPHQALAQLASAQAEIQRVLHHSMINPSTHNLLVRPKSYIRSPQGRVSVRLSDDREC